MPRTRMTREELIKEYETLHPKILAGRVIYGHIEELLEEAMKFISENK